MPSKARKAFDSNAEDIQRLLDLHGDVGGRGPGRRYGLEVLNKSAVVLITAFWEAYCEDIAAEALDHLILHAETSDSLPLDLRKLIARKVKLEKHELEVWKLSGDGWRQYLKDHRDDLTDERNRRLNTPKSAQIDELFRSAVGLSKVSSSWSWPKKMTVRSAREKLDRYVTLRGSIAHRGKHETSVTKAKVTDYFDFVKVLVAKTGGAVNAHVRKSTGKPLWKPRTIARTGPRPK